MNKTDVVSGGVDRSAVLAAIETAVKRRVGELFNEWTRSQVDPTVEQPRCSRCGAWVAARPRWKVDLEPLPPVGIGPAPTVRTHRRTDRP